MLDERDGIVQLVVLNFGEGSILKPTWDRRYRCSNSSTSCKSRTDDWNTNVQGARGRLTGGVVIILHNVTPRSNHLKGAVWSKRTFDGQNGCACAYFVKKEWEKRACDIHTGRTPDALFYS